jgi:hypothetical protein
MEFAARMNAPMYPDAVHNAVAAPIIANGPASDCELCSSLSASISNAGPLPGPMPRMVSISDRVADGPSRPSTEAGTMRPGKIDRTL